MAPLQLLGRETQRPYVPRSSGLNTSPLQGSGSLANPLLQNQYAATTWLKPRERIAAPRVRSRREVEVQWRRTHADALRPYAGQWVVLEKDRIVAAGPSLRDAITQARASGLRVPYAFRVEEIPENIAIIGL